jgi:hypothetical protein
MRSTRLSGNRHQASATPLCAVVRRLCTHPQASRETLPAATPATAVCPRRSCRTTPVRPGSEPRAFVPPSFIWVHLLLVAGYRLRRSLQTSRAQVGRAPQRRHECAGVSRRPCSTGLSSGNQVCTTDDTSARGKTRVIRTAIAGAGSARERHIGGNRSAVVGERRGRVAVGIGLGKEISGLLLGGC